MRSYLPESFMPQYEEMRQTVLSWLEVIGIAGSDAENSAGLYLHLVSDLYLNTSLDSSKARQAFNNAEAALNKVKDDKKNAEEDLDEIFDIHGFGAEGEWKKLDGTCLELNTGE
jgi:protein kinase C substrate 80K-H